MRLVIQRVKEASVAIEGSIYSRIGHDLAIPLYDLFCTRLSELLGREAGRGQFGADMQVAIINDGPVTIVIDSRLRE